MVRTWRLFCAAFSLLELEKRRMSSREKGPFQVKLSENTELGSAIAKP